MNTILFMLKRALRDKSRAIPIIAAEHLFSILEVFSETKNSSAPTIYKALVFSIVENLRDTQIREFFYSNFKILFKQNQNIPIGLLAEPLIRQLMMQSGN